MEPSTKHRVWPWVHVVLAAMAMVMTIPSRTQGLGLITEPIISDASLRIGRADFAWLNLIATLGGAFFALPVGWLIDRFRIRWVLILNLALLGIATWYFAQTETRRSFFIGMLLMRGLGQSALSATSLTLIGKWFPLRVAPAMAVFGIISTIGFIIIFSAVEPMVVSNGWRNTWQMLGYMLLGLAAICLFVARNPQRVEQNIEASVDIPSTTWTQAMMSPTFWLFALSSALFNWVSSGIGLFNEDVLKEAGFTRDHLRTALGISTMVTLLSNGLAGWLSTRWSLNSLMAVGMLMLAACLLILPYMTVVWHVYVNAVCLGISAGIVIVVFFACWGSFYGPQHLGKIQGTAQFLTVLSSALGPVSLALCKEQYDSYRPLFYLLAGLAAVSAALCVGVPALAGKRSQTQSG